MTILALKEQLEVSVINTRFWSEHRDRLVNTERYAIDDSKPTKRAILSKEDVANTRTTLLRKQSTERIYSRPPAYFVLDCAIRDVGRCDGALAGCLLLLEPGDHGNSNRHQDDH